MIAHLNGALFFSKPAKKATKKPAKAEPEATKAEPVKA